MTTRLRASLLRAIPLSLLAVLAPTAATASPHGIQRADDTYLPLIAVGTEHPLVFASLSSLPKGGFTSLPTGLFTLKLENDFPISIVYSLSATDGGSVSTVNPDPLEKLGVIGPGRTLTLNLRLNALSSKVQVTASVTSARAIAVNVIGDAVFGSFLPLSPNDLNNLFGAAQGGIGSLVSEAASDAIQPYLQHLISPATAVVRLGKLLTQLATNHTYSRWIAEHLGKSFNIFSVATLAARAAKEIGAYAGLAGAHVPGSHTMTVALQDIKSPAPTPPPSLACSGTPVVNVTWRVNNTAEPALFTKGGLYAWAHSNGSGHMQYWQTGATTFCGSFSMQGTFTTVSGRSPNGTATVRTGLTGTFTWQYTAIYNRTWNPQAPTSGDLGVFNANCSINPDHTTQCATTATPGPGTYFMLQGGNPPDLGILREEFTETYKASNGTELTDDETWVNNTLQSNVVKGDITG